MKLKIEYLFLLLLLLGVKSVVAQLPCWNLVVRDTPFYVGQDVYARIHSATKLNVISDLDSLDLKYQDTSVRNYERYLLGAARYPGIYQVRVIDPLCSDRISYLDYHFLIYTMKDSSSASSYIKPPSLSTDKDLYRQFLDSVETKDSSLINKVLNKFVSHPTSFPHNSSMFNASVVFLRNDPAVMIIADSTLKGPANETFRTHLSNTARKLSIQIVESLELQSPDLNRNFKNMLTRVFTQPNYLLLYTDGVYDHMQRFFGQQKSINNKAFVGWKTHYFSQFILAFQLPINL